MPAKLPLRLSRIAPRKATPSSASIADFSVPSRRTAHTDPATDLADIIKPAKTPRPEPSNVTPSRSPDTPADGSNPFLHGYPSASDPNKWSTSTATPDTTTTTTTTPERGTPPSERVSTRTQNGVTTSRYNSGTPRPQPSNPTQQQFNIFGTSSNVAQQGGPRRRVPVNSSHRQAAERALSGNRLADANARRQRTDMERQASRIWRVGDVYSPKELSPFEQLRARTARQRNSRLNMQSRARSRKNGGADTFDVLRLNPINEYKNFTMMSEFVTEMGRIRGARETGLRAVNQRRLAKAVRRSIGMGLVPSVHHHPELMQDREVQREYLWKRNKGMP